MGPMSYSDLFVCLMFLGLGIIASFTILRYQRREHEAETRRLRR